MAAIVQLHGTVSSSDLSSIQSWIGREPEFRGSVGRLPTLADPEQMGTVADVLTVAVASGGALTVLARSVSTWLITRKSTLKVTITDSAGKSFEITANGRAADVIADDFEFDISD